MSQKNRKLAIFISGGGTTMEAIIKACIESRLPLEPVLIISSRPDAGGIHKAKSLGINEEDILVIDPNDYLDRREFGEKILEECEKRNVEIIGQHGWMVLTPLNVIKKFTGRIINQHPGPLDTGKLDFGGAGMFGMRVHEARLEFVNEVDRDFWTEATTHFVTEEFDKGVIIKRCQVPILPGDTAETLQERVLPFEHRVQIEALRDLSLGTINIFQREVPLIMKGEEKILETCKKNAINLYPNG